MTPDYLIVGGGIIGLSTACELAGRGARVKLLERGQAGAESSWAGGGILSPLLPWDYPEAVTRLTQWSCELYPAWIAELRAASGIDPEYRQSGMLVLPEFDAGKAADWCSRHGVAFSLVFTPDRVPAIGIKSQAIWLPQVAQVRNPRLLKAVRRTLEVRGVEIVEHAEVTGLHVVDGRLAGLSTEQGEFSAGAYVIAGGAWSQKILGEHARRLDIKPIRGQMLLFKAPPGTLQTILLKDGIYLIPREDGHILAGSTMEDVGFDKTTTAEAQAGLYAQATAMLPALKNAELVRHWAGLRPGSPENIPTIARHPHIENLYLNGGHFRYGVTMAPGSARLLANLIQGREQPFDITPYVWP